MSINSFLTPNGFAGEGEYAMASLLFGAAAKRQEKYPVNALMEGASGVARKKSALAGRRSGKLIQ